MVKVEHKTARHTAVLRLEKESVGQLPHRLVIVPFPYTRVPIAVVIFFRDVSVVLLLLQTK